MRISRDLMFMMMAEAAARRSTCRRLNVGAILTYQNNVVSIGYNGPPPGEPHCYGGDCGVPMCTRSIHAEFNAIVRAADAGLISQHTATEAADAYRSFRAIQHAARLQNNHDTRVQPDIVQHEVDAVQHLLREVLG